MEGLVKTVNKAERENLKRLYEKLDAIGASNEQRQADTKDVQVLNELTDQKELVDSLDPKSTAYRQAYNDLLELGYKYYQLSGQVDDHSLPGVSASDLVHYYNRSHRTAFNLTLQTQVHEFLVQVTPVLMQLQNVPSVAATSAQFEHIRSTFQQQLTNILVYGFALDLAFYQENIESIWLVIKLARHLTPDDFKPLVKVLDKYSRMRTGHETKVGYVPDEAHLKKPKTEVAKEEKEKQARQQKLQELQQAKQASRLSIRKDADGRLIVDIPSGKHKE